MSQRIIERELGTLKRFMDDVLNIAKPRPIERFALDVNTSVNEIVESMRAEGERANVTRVRTLRRRTADHRRRPLCTRTCVSEPDHERDSGDAAGADGHGHDRARRQRHRRDASTDTGSGIPADRLAPSSTTSSRPSAAVWDWVLRHRSASSSNSTARSAFRVKWVGEHRLRSGFPGPTAAELRRPPANQLRTES